MTSNKIGAPQRAFKKSFLNSLTIFAFFVIFIQGNVFFILVEFDSDWMSPCESAKNGRFGAHGLNCKIFDNSEVIFDFYDKNYPRKKNFMSLRHVWNFRKFWNFVNFWDFEWPFWRNGHKYCQFFFVIFNQNNVLLILVEFERDRISPHESTENGRIGAHGLNCKIFGNSAFIFEIYDKNYPRKKNFMSLRRFWNFRNLTWRVPMYRLRKNILKP